MILRWSGAVVALVAGLALPLSARAQTTITLEGRVVGEGGAPIQGAQITATDVSTNQSRNALTDASGEFRILGLSSGRYTVTARFIGYRPQTEAVRLVIGQRARLAFTLEQGATELETVRVEDERVRSVEVQRTSVSTPVLEAEIRNLPLNTRNIMSLAAVAPGIRSYAPVQGRSIPSAGAVPDLRFINLYVDGVEMKSLFNGNIVGIPQTGSPLPADALQEFRVFLNPYDAEYSRAGAYVISAVSRRGANEFDGSTFGFVQNEGLVWTNEFQDTLTNFKEPAFRRQQVGLNLRGPIAKDRLFFATSYELTNTDSYLDVIPGRPVENPGLWNEYAGTFKAPNRNHTGLVRLTFAPNARHTVDAIWSGRYMNGESFFGGTVARPGGIRQRYAINVGQLRHQWLPTPSLVNEASLQVVSWAHREPQLVSRPQFSYPSIRIGTAGFPLAINETHLRLVNRATYSVNDFYGTHVIKGGVEASRVSGDQYFPINRDGAFVFNTDTSTLPRSASIGVGFFNPAGDTDANSALTGWVTGVYVNDEWRPVRNLTVNLGLRYDAELNTINNDFTVPWASDTALNDKPQLRRFLNRGDRENDLDNVSPRLSFSWDVFDNSRTFLRGGFGIIYDRVPSFIGFQERRDATWRTYTIQNPGTTDVAALRERVAAGVTATPAITLIKDRMEAPENRQLSVGVGQQVTQTLGVNVDYIYQDIRHLYARINANPFEPGSRPYRRALTPLYADIVLWDDFARARYSALVSSATYQRDDLRLNAAYTLGFAKAEYDAVTAPAFPNRSSYVMQRTAGDERHRFVLSAIVPLRFGIQLSTITTIASPRPYAVTLGADSILALGGNDNNFTGDDFPNGRRYALPDNSWENWYRNVDLRLTKQFDVGASRLSLYAEVFNLFNSINYASFFGTQYNRAGQPLTNYARPSGVFGTRQGQLGARVEF